MRRARHTRHGSRRLHHLPALTVPGDDVLEQLAHAGGVGREEILALLRGGVLWPADVPGHRAVLRGPAAISGLEAEPEADRLGPRVVLYEIGSQPPHHRRLPLAGV